MFAKNLVSGSCVCDNHVRRPSPKYHSYFLPILPKMKLILAVIFTLAFCIPAFSQTLTNTELTRRIKERHAEKSISLTFNAAGNTTTVRGVSESFSSAESKHAGILAMNFAVGFYFPGSELAHPPDKLLLSFWVLTKKPRFRESNALNAGSAAFGTARYAYKDRMDMEYLNFELRPDDIAVVAAAGKIKIGSENFTLTAEQKDLLADILSVIKTND